MIKRKTLAAVLLAVGMLTSLSGCNYSYFMVEKNEASEDAGDASSENQTYTYTNHYQDICLELPNEWEILEDKSASLTAGTASGSTMVITRKTGKAALTILPFPMDQGQVSSVMNQRYAPMAQTLEDGSVVTVQGDAHDYELSSMSFDDVRSGYCYRFRVNRSDGLIDEFIGVKLDATAYTFVLSAAAGMEAEIAAMEDCFSNLEFINNPELTAVFLNEMTDLETFDLSGLEAQNTLTCIASVNVRNAPDSQSSQVIGELRSGDKITVTGEEGNWYQFEYEGKTAYVYKEYFE